MMNIGGFEESFETPEELRARMWREAEEFVDGWWASCAEARGEGKFVRLSSDELSVQLRRAFLAGWGAR